MLTRFVVMSALLTVSPFAPAQSPATKAVSSGTALAGHYVGTAISKTGQSIPLSLDITPGQQNYSGSIRTAFGTFTVSGQTSPTLLPLRLQISGQAGQGTISLSEIGNQLRGAYTLADDSGTLSLNRTSLQVENAEASSTSLKTPILLLGVYHMANPELDATPFVADDVFTPLRQQQISDLVAQLRGFHPTKVLVEAEYGDQAWQIRYEEFLHGDAKLSANEIEQLGFRVAGAEHLPQIGCIDYEMFLNGLRPDEVRFPKPLGSSHSEHDQAAQAPSPEEKALREMTISQYLARINSPESLAAGQSQYMSMLLPDQQPDLYRGADQVANWYKRNLRIMENINRYASPGDRILVIIGAGHIPLLRQFAAASSYFTVVDPLPFLTPASH